MPARAALPLTLLLTLAACDDDPMMGSADTDAETGSTDAEATVDAQAITDQALDFASLEKFNDEPVPSQHGLANTMNLWVDAGALSAYEGLGAGTVFVPGTYIIKEQINGDGTLNSMAVMFKGPQGYAPDAGDWWFGVVNPDGSIVVGGQPGSCVGCHADVAEQDWAWGLEG